MIISYQGGEFFKAQFGDTVLAFNPVSKESTLKASRFGADVALVSLNHPDTNGGDQLGIGDKQPFVVSGPGEYEIKGIFVRGFKSDSTYGGSPKINTIYTLSLDSINMCFLGALGTAEIAKETEEALDDIDILFVPIGGHGVLDAAAAYKLAVKLEPKIIIPMHYGDMSAETDKNALKAFLKEAGEEKTAAIDKLTIKKKDLEGKQGDIVVLAASNS